MLQDKGDCAGHFGKGADRRIRLKNCLRRFSRAKVVHQYIRADSRAGQVIAALADFQMLIRRQARHSSLIPRVACLKRRMVNLLGVAEWASTNLPSRSLARAWADSPPPEPCAWPV